MHQEGLFAVNNAGLPLDFLVLTKKTEASGNETAIPLNNHAFPFGFFVVTLSYVVVLPCQAFPLEIKRLILFS